MKQLTLNFTDEEFKEIEDCFEIIKKGKSKLKTREDMLKLLIMKDVKIGALVKKLSQ
ncbi:MAG: hypothetical protein AABY22_28450 [Nanoarchaeota archaeon]